jgi:hypothetical protein
MAELTAEQAMRRACDLILAGDFFAVAADLTPEAYNDAMLLATGLTGVPLPDSYTLASHSVSGADHVFRVTFHTSVRDFDATAAWREVDGAWKIASIKVDGLG